MANYYGKSWRSSTLGVAVKFLCKSMSFPNDEFQQLLCERKPLSTLLSEEKFEKAFRQALRHKSENVVEYLSSREILLDIVDGLINEDVRTFQDASESLGILLADIDPILDGVIAEHLPTLFSYLDNEKHQPRRVYFFLRVMSFLFQIRTPEMFMFVNEHPEVVKKLVKHIKSPHILQLILNMLAVERQMKDFQYPNLTWSENCALLSKVVEALEENPEENLDAVQKFFSEVCLSYPSDSDFVKNILLVQDAALIKSVIGMMDNKNTATDAIKLLDQVILGILMDNKDNMEFYTAATDQLQFQKNTLQNLLNSDSLILALAGTKLVQSLVKHKLSNLLDGGTTSCLNLMMKFKWSNVLHTVISDTLCYIFKTPDVELINQLLDQGKILEKIIETFSTEEQVGYRGHLRIVANAIRDCPVPELVDRLKSDQQWTLFLEHLNLLNDTNIGYREAENRKSKIDSTATMTLDTVSSPPYSAIPILPILNSMYPLNSDPPPPYPGTPTTVTTPTTTLMNSLEATEGEVVGDDTRVVGS